VARTAVQFSVCALTEALAMAAEAQRVVVVQHLVACLVAVVAVVAVVVVVVGLRAEPLALQEVVVYVKSAMPALDGAEHREVEAIE
jgi:hypothetical protein